MTQYQVKPPPVRDLHPGPTNNNTSPLHMRLLICDHHHGQTSTSSTTCTPWLTPSLVSILPLGLTSTIVIAKPQVTSFHISFISTLYLGHLRLQLQMVD
jgi:hypothetical protein